MTTRAAVLSILSLSLFLFFLLPPLDPDLGWHLRCGQEIWQGNLFCHRNDFSLLLVGYEWPNHFWLYEALLYPVYRLAGHWGLTVLGAVVSGGAFLWLIRAWKGPDWAKLAALPVVIFLSWGVLNLGVRGQIAGFFFFCLVLYLLVKRAHLQDVSHLRGDRKGLLGGGWLFLVMQLWANTHGSVILGVILLGAFGFREFQKRGYKFSPDILVYPLSGLMTLVNPFGWRIYEDAWRHFAGVNLANLIAEWVPPPPSYQAIILIIAGITAGLVFAKRKKVGVWQTPLLLVFAIAALKARRQVPHFAAISAYLIFENFGRNLN